MRDADGTSHELRLKAADGHILPDMDWKTQFFNSPLKIFVEQVFDAMMDSVQTEFVPDVPYNVSFIGKGGNDIFAGSKFNDILWGAAGDDVLSGRVGNDSIAGGSGKDSLIGGWGDDTLNGGLGLDTMSGNGDADTLVFNSVLAARGDRITDFVLADGDRIDLRLVDAIAGNVGFDGFLYIRNTGFGGHAGESRLGHGPLNTFVEADTNGDGHADFTIVLSASVAIDATAFIL